MSNGLTVDAEGRVLAAEHNGRRVSRVADDGTPTGLAFSPDESILYIDDSAHKHIRAFDVRPDGTLTGSRVLLDMASNDPGVPDGLKVDLQGNIFCTGPGGVWVCRSDGALLGRIV